MFEAGKRFLQAQGLVNQSTPRSEHALMVRARTVYGLHLRPLDLRTVKCPDELCSRLGLQSPQPPALSTVLIDISTLPLALALSGQPSLSLLACLAGLTPLSRAPIAVVVTEWLMALLLLLYVKFVAGSECWAGFTRAGFRNWMPMVPLPLPRPPPRIC